MLGTVHKSCLTKLVCNKFFQAKREVQGEEREWGEENRRKWIVEWRERERDTSRALK